MEEQPEQVEFSLNYRGEDYTVLSDIHTANILLNDPVAATNFLQANYPQIFQPQNKNIKLQDNNRSIEVENPETTEAREEIWTKRKPSANDLRATRLLLSFRHELSKEFDDKKTIKSKLWHKIANALRTRNFNLGPTGAERCRQKFSNLCKGYLAFIKNQKTTGKEAIDLPPFYDEIHLILGSKYKAVPQHLEDSIDETQQQTSGNENETEVDEAEPCPDPSTDPVSRFSKSKKTVRPLSKTESVLFEMREDRKQREHEFEFIKGHVVKASDQRDKFLNILGKLVRKRKREDSDSD